MSRPSRTRGLFFPEHARHNIWWNVKIKENVPHVENSRQRKAELNYNTGGAGYSRIFNTRQCSPFFVIQEFWKIFHKLATGKMVWETLQAFLVKLTRLNSKRTHYVRIRIGKISSGNIPGTKSSINEKYSESTQSTQKVLELKSVFNCDAGHSDFLPWRDKSFTWRDACLSARPLIINVTWREIFYKAVLFNFWRIEGRYNIGLEVCQKPYMS